MAVLALALLGASTDEPGCGLGEDKKLLCWDCFLPDDCKSDTCTCVDNQETGARWCWACVPKDFDPLTGRYQDLTYSCPKVFE